MLPFFAVDVPRAILETARDSEPSLPQVLGAGLASRLPDRDFVSGSVVFQNQWMIHGDIRRTLFKVTYWIASR